MTEDEVRAMLEKLPAKELVAYILSLVDKDIVDLDNVVDVLLVN